MVRHHLGINLGHDRSAAIVVDGQLVVAIEQERLDRNKHSVGFLYQTGGDTANIQIPGNSIRYCLDALGLSYGDLATVTANMPGEDFGPEIIRANFSADIAEKVRPIPSHHLAHAYSAWWPSGFDEGLVLVVDATGTTEVVPGTGWRTESYSLYAAHGTELEPIHSETVAAHLAGLSTLGFVYEFVSRKAGFVTEVSSLLKYAEAGKLMGLAPYGGPQVNWHKWLKPVAGTYQLGISAYDIMLEVAALEKKYDDGSGKPHLRPWLVDLSYKIQSELEDALLHVVEHAISETGLKKLCLAGGVALNSVANYQLLVRGGLEGIFVFPAAGDNGIAAGCAYWAYHQDGGRERPRLEIATLGQSYPDELFQSALSLCSSEITFTRLDDDKMIHQTCQSLAQGNVVARFDGGCEFGPRALGNRSIMADPTFARMKDVLNSRVKFREAFRPFAPVIPRDRAAEVFELEVDSPFMLLVSQVRKEFHDILPAITHHDGTGRVQTVTEETCPFFFHVCNGLAEHRDGPPVLLNTSFNVAGQPIVETPIEALRTFLKSDMDFLSLGNYWVSKRNVPVLNYSAHLEGIPDEPIPQGLPADQPGVNELMKSLDEALFEINGDQAAWSDEELGVLSTEAGRYRETSELFTTPTFDSPLRTQLSDDVVLVLDPLGISQLVDLRAGGETQDCTREDVEFLLKVLDGPDSDTELLRRRCRLTGLEFRRRIQWALNQCARFGIDYDPSWLIAYEPDSVLPDTGTVEPLASFADESFSLRRRLRQLHDLLEVHKYNETHICELLKCDSLQQIEPTHLHYYDQQRLPDSSIGDLIRLFLLRVALPVSKIVDLFGEDLFETMQAIGLLIPREEKWASRVDLYCSGGLFLATDHRYLFLEEDRLDEDPVMYIGMDSHGLVQTAPELDAENLLDLCCGSGIQGLVASRYASNVTSVDLNPRAIRFTRFNAQLNGIENIQVHLDDLYAAVEGRRFDTILANPPFVPSPNEEYRFRDGGSNGEAILRRIVSESHHYLNDPGRLFIVTDLVDVDRYKDKLAEWWHGGPVDQLVLKTADRDDLLFSVPHSHAPFHQGFDSYNLLLEQWIENFHREGLTAVNFGYILLCGSGHHESTYYSRTIHNPTTPMHHHVERFFDCRRLLNHGDADKLHLRLNDKVRIRSDDSVNSTRVGTELHVVDDPFFTTYEVSEFMARSILDIHRSQPRFEEITNPENCRWVTDLLLKGLFQLAPRVQDHTPTQGSAPQHGPTEITERETKTTPTCLSSYLN